MIYLDHAATTPLDPAVFEAMLEFLRPGGVHGNPAASQAMAGADDNQTVAAKTLGISRYKLRRLLKAHQSNHEPRNS